MPKIVDMDAGWQASLAQRTRPGLGKVTAPQLPALDVDEDEWAPLS
jgi:hypothetical protein